MRVLSIVGLVVGLVACGSTAGDDTPPRRTPYNEACRLLNAGMGSGDVQHRLVETFWPDPSNGREREYAITVSLREVLAAARRGCGR